MKSLLLLPAGLVLTFAVQSQTRLIALKSHSGRTHNYRTERFGNFGVLPMPKVRLETVEKLDDSTVVLFNRVGTELVFDTVVHHPQFSGAGLTEKQLRELYNDQVNFTHFNKKPRKPAPPRVETPVTDPAAPGTLTHPSAGTEKPAVRKPLQTCPRKGTDPKRKENRLWLLLIIGGGTFLGTGTIAAARRRRTAFQMSNS